jgi:hypothetical protein
MSGKHNDEQSVRACQLYLMMIENDFVSIRMGIKTDVSAKHMNRKSWACNGPTDAPTDMLIRISLDCFTFCRNRVRRYGVNRLPIARGSQIERALYDAAGDVSIGRPDEGLHTNRKRCP